MRLGLVILNKNEAQSLEKLIPTIDKSSFDSNFAVDGGSLDGSRKILSNAGFEVLQQESLGRGEAFKLAFEHAENLKLDALVFFSSDGNEDANDLKRFRVDLEHGFDMVIASRMTKGARNEEDDKVLRFRKWGNKVFAWLAFLTFGRGQNRISDPINGFRAITVDAWKKMGVSATGFSVEYETSIKAYKMHLKVAEFPTCELHRIAGQSTATAFKTTKAMLISYKNNIAR